MPIKRLGRSNSVSKITGTNEITASGLAIKATGGNTEYEYVDGGTTYKSHIFTSSSTDGFKVTGYELAPNSVLDPSNINYSNQYRSDNHGLIGSQYSDPNATCQWMVLGGGGGGGGSVGGGGGAGGLRSSEGPGGPSPSPESELSLTLGTNYPVVIGGGASRAAEQTSGSPGTPSSFAGKTSEGGGGAGSASGTADNQPGGRPGGCGGGGGFYPSTGNDPSKPAGAGNQTPAGSPVPNQGFGGGAIPGSPSDGAGGGGGGTGQVGEDNPDGTARYGGNGRQNSLIWGPNNPQYFGGGGGGLGNSENSSVGSTKLWYRRGSGGLGGGGGAASSPSSYNASDPGGSGTPNWCPNLGGGSPGGNVHRTGQDSAQYSAPGHGTAGGAGAQNSGSGGGGSWNYSNPAGGGSGGSGLVVVRHKSPSNLKATGGIITRYNNKVIHAFVDSGSFIAPSSFNETIEYVVIGAGGGGGADRAGGGGAGAYVFGSTPISSPQIIPITINAGGAGNVSNSNGANGGSTVFGSIVTAPGGGGGGGAATNNSQGDGQDGASGGGCSRYNPVSGALSPEPTRGLATHPSGNPGGLAYNGADPNDGAGGGGGTGSAGGNGDPAFGGAGGFGTNLPTTFRVPNFIIGVPGPTGNHEVAGGGGGGSWPHKNGQGNGGGGGGGYGTGSGFEGGQRGQHALKGHGAGGGGGGGYPGAGGGNGSSGCVLIAYPE